MMMTYRPVASPALSPPLLGIISMGFSYSSCLITSSEEVCLSVCFVCLSATLRKTADRYSWKFYQRYNLWTWNSPLNFQSHPDPDQNRGIFEGIFFTVVRVRKFGIFWRFFDAVIYLTSNEHSIFVLYSGSRSWSLELYNGIFTTVW